MTRPRPEAPLVEETESASPRAYRSPLRARRAAETRTALLLAANQLFTTSGWTGTGMRDVAALAGVATETVYTYFPSKRALFQAVVDVAVVGDDQPVALAERAEFAALGQGTRAERISAAAHVLTGVHVRTAAFAKVLREAANSRPGNRRLPRGHPRTSTARRGGGPRADGRFRGERCRPRRHLGADESGGLPLAG